MEKKLVIWLQGSYGTGKTSQVRHLIKLLSGGQNPEQIISDKCFYTVYGKSGISVLGKMNKNQCTGLDSVYGELKAEGVANTLKMALDNENVSIVLLECVFATFSWYTSWEEFRGEFNLLSVHLESTLWNNYKRIQERRAKKQGRTDWYNIELEDTVYKNVGNKNRETRVIFDKLVGNHPKSVSPLTDYNLRFDCTEDEITIHNRIKDLLLEIL